jgi:septal ring factor EnvC (AmiA/AmiB activator)
MFPKFIPLYERVFSYRKEASDMTDIYYEALQIMNRNTELYMVEELQEQKKQLQEELDKKDTAITQKNVAIAQLQSDNKQQEKEIQRLRKQLADLQEK